jgi:hypothetical protein
LRRERVKRNQVQVPKKRRCTEGQFACEDASGSWRMRIRLTRVVAMREHMPECAIVSVGFRQRNKMAERPVLVGLIPQAVVLDPGDQVSWLSDAGNLRVEFDVNRCPFSSNVFQAPSGMRLLSGPPRPGSKAAAYKYRLWLNDQLVGHGEVILREK